MMQDFPTRLQRAFVELVTEYARAQGWKKSQFAQNVWPQAPAKAAAAKWSAMRGQAAHTGKPQGVLLSDAQQMAETLGEDLSFLIAIAKENARRLP
ncbi:MAG: hypothetical protein AB7U63_09630 [Porticoccaceae bacterium]